MTTNTIAEVAAADLAAVEAFCDRWEKAWNDHDAEAVAALCSEDLVYDEPTLGDTVHSRDPIRGFVNRMATNIPDYHLERLGLYAEVTRRAVLVAWHLTGTVAGTDQPIEFHGDDRLELGEDGLIHAYRCLYDNKHVLEQIAAAAATRA
jgi:steroid delta-isomerase-like uncharacterized protein